jgi:catechol 2,3-dioxygenase-like lactoylglutathione lyase family enzyme
VKLHHLAVVVADLARAEAFYRGFLGLEVVRRQEGRSIWLGLEAGAFLAVEQATAAEPRRADAAPGWHCVALAIAKSDREVWRARAAQAGYAVERESPHTLYLRDPDGNLVALSHYPE